MDLQHRRSGSLDRADEAEVDYLAERGESEILERGNPGRFKKNEFVVYAAHGVGQITAIEVQTVAGASLEFIVIYFAKLKMKARVPTQKASSVGLRKLSDPAVIEQVRRTLSQAASRARTNWARSAKEYETKVKSGDIIALAEVMRDLHRQTAAYERSYSEQQFYATALDRLSGEVALVEQITEENAVLELEGLLKARPGKDRNRI